MSPDWILASFRLETGQCRSLCPAFPVLQSAYAFQESHGHGLAFSPYSCKGFHSPMNSYRNLIRRLHRSSHQVGTSHQYFSGCSLLHLQLWSSRSELRGFPEPGSWSFRLNMHLWSTVLLSWSPVPFPGQPVLHRVLRLPVRYRLPGLPQTWYLHHAQPRSVYFQDHGDAWVLREVCHYLSGADRYLAHPEYKPHPQDRNRSASQAGFSVLLHRKEFLLHGQVSDIPDPHPEETAGALWSLLISVRRSSAASLTVPDCW